MQCVSPVQIDVSGQKMDVPCGKCYACIQRRISGWSFRLKMEDKQAISSKFVTLTYNSENIPISNNGYRSLQKTDVQKFFKRLRKLHATYRDVKQYPIKYYACGEYGTHTQRPHYHIILFNAYENDVIRSWVNVKTKQPIGDVHFGDVTSDSIAYCFKYLQKDKLQKKHSRDDRNKEFQLFSKRLGANFLTKEMINWYRDVVPDFTKQVTPEQLETMASRYYVPDGEYKKSLPRYYKDRIYTTMERQIIGQQLVKKSDKQKMEFIEKDPLYFHNEKERHIAAERKMKKNSLDSIF